MHTGSNVGVLQLLPLHLCLFAFPLNNGGIFDPGPVDSVGVLDFFGTRFLLLYSLRVRVMIQ